MSDIILVRAPSHGDATMEDGWSIKGWINDDEGGDHYVHVVNRKNEHIIELGILRDLNEKVTFILNTTIQSLNVTKYGYSPQKVKLLTYQEVESIHERILKQCSECQERFRVRSDR